MLPTQAPATEQPFSPGNVINAVVDMPESRAVVTSDMNGDGKIDVCASSFQNPGQISCWLSSGGGWNPIWVNQTFQGAFGLDAGDVDGDGDIDLAAAGQTGDELSWFENNGLGTVWIEHPITSTTFDSARSVKLVDLDGDGDLDAVGAASLQQEVAWWENTAGDGSTWSKTTIDGTLGVARFATAGDIDGDGDQDVVAGSATDDEVVWYENPGWTKRTIGGMKTPTGIVVADIDGDGHLDVGGGSASTDPWPIRWWKNTVGDGTLWTEILVDNQFKSTLYVTASDVDRDGDQDLVAAAFFSANNTVNKISWFENLAGDGSSWQERNVVSSFEKAHCVAVADLDGDGDLDMVGTAADATSGQVQWFENMTLHRSAAFAGRVDIDTELTTALSITTGDLDGDGDLDVVSAAAGSNVVAWWENLGAGALGPRQDIVPALEGVQWATTADLDGDGDVDVAYAADVGGGNSSDEVGWAVNRLDEGLGWTRVPILVGYPRPRAVTTCDVNGDGALDVVTAVGAAGGDVTWFANPGASPDTAPWTRNDADLEGTFPSGYGVACDDVDADGDVDLVAVSQAADDVIWLENRLDETDPTWDEHQVANDFFTARTVAVADVNSDGLLDLVAGGVGDDVATGESTLSWFENPTWTEHVVEVEGTTRTVAAVDLDGDGDMDILNTAGNDNVVRWWENDGAQGFTSHVVGTVMSNATGLAVADLDDDGDLDVVATGAQGTQHAVWFENRGGQFALPTSDGVTSATPDEGTQDVLVLEVGAAHRGRSGDGDLELVTLELLFEETAGDPLSDSEMNALVDAVRIYRDTSNGTFEPGSDTEFFAVPSPFSLTDGVLTCTFVDDEADVQVAYDSNQTYFVAVDLAVGGAVATPNTLQVTHLTESSSTAQMATTNIPLTLEFVENTVSTLLMPQPDRVITVDPGGVDFGQQQVSGGASVGSDIVISNIGSATLNLTSVDLTGADAGEFSIISDTGEAALATGATRTVTVSFDPNSEGLKAAAVSIVSDDADSSPTDVVVSGLGVEPEIVVSPLLLDFGYRQVDAGPTAPQAVTITNSGTSTLQLSSVDLDDTTHFQITADTGETALSSAQTRTVSIVFDPATPGVHTATLTITSNDADEATVEVIVSGEDPYIFVDGFEDGTTDAWSVPST